MRLFLSLWLLLWAVPVTAQTYPPELEPLVPVEIVLRAMGLAAWDEVPVEVPEGDTVTIDALVVLASGVSSSHCTTGPDQTNLALTNSALPLVRMRLVHCYSSAYVDTDVSTDLSRLQALADGFLDEVHVLRNQYGADTVLLIVKNVTACGKAYRPASAVSAFAVVSEQCTPGNFSFPHEWGHNMGLNHDAAQGLNATWPYAYGWCFGNGFKDVMVYPSPCGGQRVAHFSNPNVLYQGVPTGNAASADGARVIRERAAIVAGFRTSTTSVSAPRPSGQKPIPKE